MLFAWEVLHDIELHHTEESKMSSKDISEDISREDISPLKEMNEQKNYEIQSQQRIKYRLQGLSCSNCATKIEKAFCSEKTIGDTVVNFATQTVYLPPEALELAQQIVERIEPGVKLNPVDLNENRIIKQSQGLSDSNWILFRLILSSCLFIFGLVLPLVWDSPHWVYEYLIFLTAYGLVGYQVLYTALNNLVKGSLFDENFLMSLATIGAIAIHQLPEAVGVMLFYTLGEYIQDLAVNRSRHSIQALLSIRPDYANLIHDSVVIKVDPEDVQIGQLVLVQPGERIPLDGEVTSGSSFVDTSSLTGESVPRRVEVGDTVLSGTVNCSGVLKVKVAKSYVESSFQKILELVENASTRKAKAEKFITKFSYYYTPGVVITALVIAFLPPLLGAGTFSHWIYRALTILVISCPCALVISVPLGYFGGIGGASRHGVLIKGANYLEALDQVGTVVFDKTGTLTQGVFEVIEISPTEGLSEEYLIKIAAIAEIHSHHPIATSIRKAYGLPLESDTLDEYEELGGRGIRAKIGGEEVLVGKASFLEQGGISVKNVDEVGMAGTQVHVAMSKQYVGYILIADRIRADARDTITNLGGKNIRTVMLTGDQKVVAERVAKQLGVSEFHADLLPQDKVTWLERFMEEKEQKGNVIFVGDGINDAPVLTRADIGIAMGGLGSDAAIEAADVVLMEDKPAKLITAIEIAHFTKKVIWQNIFIVLGIKLGFIIFGILGMATMWEAVFADVGVALLAILNANRVRLYSSPIISKE